MHTKLPNESTGSLLIVQNAPQSRLRQTSLEYTGLYCTFLLQSVHFPYIACHLHSLSIYFFILHIVSISHWTSSLHYQLHEDMFLAITSHRCEESWMVTAVIRSSSGLLGLSNFHLLAEAGALRRSENTHWILARRVSNEIVVMRAFCCELKLVKVIQSSAARYEQACVLVNVWDKQKKNSLNACLPARDNVCGCVACVRT